MHSGLAGASPAPAPALASKPATVAQQAALMRYRLMHIVVWNLPVCNGSRRDRQSRSIAGPASTFYAAMVARVMRTQRPSILLAEDESELAQSIARDLADIGMRVEIYGDGPGADAALTRGAFDAAILDVGLPDLDGFAVLSRLRARDKMLPVLMLTARGDVADRVRGLNLGADDYVGKPFALDELEARMRALLRPVLDRKSVV